ncbi:MAG TPA: hypothetical protein VG407_17880 [Caulobacteraceae bacterium]|nr:hypothetical protein [Caulobacteraceae bacterium]
MRSSKSIASVLGGLAVAGIGAAALTYAVAGASADSSGPDPDRALVTNRMDLALPPESRIEAVERKAADAATLASAVHPKPTPIEWAEGASAQTATWAQPKLNGLASFAGQYEPRFDLHMVRKGDTDESRIEVSLARKAEAPTPIVGRLGSSFASTQPRKLRDRGHWFAFAAGGSNAVGVNWLNDPQGQLRRAGWSSEHVAAVGQGQVGIGWRKGSLQASFGAVQRELSAYGHSVNERFLAFTLSFSPGSGGGGGTRPTSSRAWMERDDAYYARRR